MHDALFFPHKVLSHWVPCKVFNEASIMRIIRYVYFFSFTRFFSHWVLFSKFLTRHIIYRHSRGSVINNLCYSECLIMWSPCRIWLENTTWGPSKIFPINKGFSFFVNKIGERSMNPEYTSNSLFSSPYFLLLLNLYSFITCYKHDCSILKEL